MQHTVTQTAEVVGGQFTLTAANGDAVCGSYHGQGIAESLDPLLIRFEGTFTIDGGTGRFAGATGSGELTGLIDPFPDDGAPTGTEADLMFDGTISRPSAGRGDADDGCPAILIR